MARFPKYWPSSADTVWIVTSGDDWPLAIHVYGNPSAPRPAVVCFHGALSNSRTFDIAGYGLAPYLRAVGFNVFCVDFRGRGWSLPPEKGHAGWTIDDFIEHDIPAAIDVVRHRAGVDVVDVVGHSLGGISTLGYLARGGEGVGRVATLGSSVYVAPSPILYGLERLFGNSATVPIAGFAERMGFIASWIPMNGWSWCANPENLLIPEFHKFLVCGSGDISMRKILHLKLVCEEGRLVSADGSFDYSTGLGGITHEIQLYKAAADRLVPPELVDRTAGALSAAKVEVVSCGRSDGFSCDYGHLDLAIGAAASQEIFPSIQQFLQRKRVAARRRGVRLAKTV